jgi:hypothetical protein
VIVALSQKPRRVHGPQAVKKIPFVFRGGVYFAKNTLRGESVFRLAKGQAERTGWSENLLVPKEQRSFGTR